MAIRIAASKRSLENPEHLALSGIHPIRFECALPQYSDVNAQAGPYPPAKALASTFTSF
jgi:hypothetical protein